MGRLSRALQIKPWPGGHYLLAAICEATSTLLCPQSRTAFETGRRTDDTFLQLRGSLGLTAGHFVYIGPAWQQDVYT